MSRLVARCWCCRSGSTSCVLSPLLGPRCRFYPSCSAYAVEALTAPRRAARHLAGGAPAARCHPWNPGGLDPVPPSASGHRRRRRSRPCRRCHRCRRCHSCRCGPQGAHVISDPDSGTAVQRRHVHHGGVSFLVHQRWAMRPSGGLAWALSIVGLVVVIRILLIPLFVKQINAQRGLQMLQPEMKKLQAKYKGKSDPESRQKQHAGDDEALQGQRDQPARQLPADPAAGADLLRAVPGAQRHRPPAAADPARPAQHGTRRSRPRRRQIFGAHAVRQVHRRRRACTSRSSAPC